MSLIYGCCFQYLSHLSEVSEMLEDFLHFLLGYVVLEGDLGEMATRAN